MILTDVHVDDVGAFTKDGWDNHLKLLDKMLGLLLDENEFSANPLKREWGIKEIDWLGYWSTPAGLKPLKKKVDAILQMEPQKNIKQMRSFWGAVKYYTD